MNRREMIRTATAAALGAAAFPLGWTAAADGAKKRLLLFTRSQGYEHDVVKPKANKLGLAEQIMTDLAAKHGFAVTCTKDGRVMLAEETAKYDAFFFYTPRDLTAEGGDKQPPMPPEGKKALLKA